MPEGTAARPSQLGGGHPPRVLHPSVQSHLRRPGEIFATARAASSDRPDISSSFGVRPASAGFGSGNARRAGGNPNSEIHGLPTFFRHPRQSPASSFPRRGSMLRRRRRSTGLHSFRFTAEGILRPVRSDINYSGAAGITAKEPCHDFSEVAACQPRNGRGERGMGRVGWTETERERERKAAR